MIISQVFKLKFKKEPKTNTTPVVVITDVHKVQEPSRSHTAPNSAPVKSKGSKEFVKKGKEKDNLFKRRPLSLQEPINSNKVVSECCGDCNYSVDKANHFDNWRSNFSKVELASLLLTPREQERQEIIYELIASEAAYVNDLDFVLTKFIIPLKQQSVLSEEVISQLFGNWIELVQLHTTILGNLLQRQKQQSPVILEVVDVVLEQVSRLEIYYPFLLQQPQSIQLYTHLLQTNKKFNNFVKSANLELDLASYLLKPMQRLVKYPLLFKNLSFNSSSATLDYLNLNTLLKELGKVLDKVQLNSFQLQHKRTLNFWKEELNLASFTFNFSTLLDSIWCHGYAKFKSLNLSEPGRSTPANASHTMNKEPNSFKSEDWKLQFLILFPTFMFQLPLTHKPDKDLKPSALLTSDDPNLKLVKVQDVKLVRSYRRTEDDVIELHLISEKKMVQLVKFDSCSLNTNQENPQVLTKTWVELLRSAVVTHNT